MAEITKEQYDKALILLAKVEDAERAVRLYEDQVRWTEDPVAKIMEESKPEYIEGEQVRGELLWRATKLRYVHEKGTVERVIEYAEGPNSKGILAVKSDNKKLI